MAIPPDSTTNYANAGIPVPGLPNLSDVVSTWNYLQNFTGNWATQQYLNNNGLSQLIIKAVT